MRTPLRGVGNIVRFNYHFYLVAIAAIIALFVVGAYSEGWSSIVSFAVGFTVVVVLATSLLASAWIYDWSGLYTYRWLDLDQSRRELKTIVNVHAGFDETSRPLSERFPDSQLIVYDFYDPKLHTEVSIARARRAYAPFPGTKKIDTRNPGNLTEGANVIFLLLAAHEIRRETERIAFFRQLSRSLSPRGEIVVLEHTRDWKNFIAFNLGFLHFYSRRVWRRTFSRAGLIVRGERLHTPFLTIFYLMPA